MLWTSNPVLLAAPWEAITHKYPVRSFLDSDILFFSHKPKFLS